jgi:hypothetical protein
MRKEEGGTRNEERGMRNEERGMRNEVGISSILHLPSSVLHQLPDKAIDLVDKAGARTRVPVLSMMPGGKDGRRETGGIESRIT